MSRHLDEQHADWLSLVEPEGQFLTLPVLQRAFPNGLDNVRSTIRSDVREHYPRGAEPTGEQWNAWTDWLLRNVLGWGPQYRTGSDVSAYVLSVPEHATLLRAHGALSDPQTGKPRVLVMVFPHGTALDRRQPGERWNASPIERLKDLCKAHEVRIGMVTDGEHIVVAWVPNLSGGYATWPTALFLENRERGLLQSFVSLLSASRFFAVREDVQIDALFETSEKAQNEVTDQLGYQIRQAVELLVNSISRANLERNGKLLDAVPPQTVYEAAVTVMMRLVFMLYAEECDLLPLSDPLYAQAYAASTLREQLDEQAALEGDEPLERRSSAWNRLLAAFRVIYGGLNHDRLRMIAYGGRLFDPDRFSFLEGRTSTQNWEDSASKPLPVDDLTVRAIMEAIQTLPIRRGKSNERRRLSFRSLDVEQIGHVYEGLLDHGAIEVDDVYVGLIGKTGDEAELPLHVIERAAKQGESTLRAFLADKTKRSEAAIVKLLKNGQLLVEGKDPEMRRLLNTVCDNDASLSSRIAPIVYTLRSDLHGLPVVFPAGSLVVKQTRARRDSGTEYTPRELADEMVKHALEPLVYSPGPRDGVESSQWKLRPSSDLLDLKICDPAVGSGAFLVSACRFLADRVVEAWFSEKSNHKHLDAEDLLLEARRAVVERCLYGVDLDSMAVEMAKLSLWLTTMHRERPFSFLDHSIREGDSLLGLTSLDQIYNVHIDPTIGKSLHSGSLFNATAVIEPLLEHATRLRRELGASPSVTYRDAESKRSLNDKANQLLAIANVVADAVVAAALSTATNSEKDRNAAYHSVALSVRLALDPSLSEDQRANAVDSLCSNNHQVLNAQRLDTFSPRITLHWPLAFPEVFNEPRGFDAIVGNPPFVGGKKISGAFGSDFREYLVRYVADGRKGNADLVSYFFLRASTLTESFAFLAVNTIAQGDTREVGLEQLLGEKWRIVRATKSRPWPGAAGVHIAQIWLSRTSDNQEAVLDGTLVRNISSSLVASQHDLHPFRLYENTGTAFEGIIPLGTGFTMSSEDAEVLIQKNARYRDVLFPYLIADDLCSRPGGEPGRWIVNFFDWPLEKARTYKECFAHVDRLVRPQRLAKKGAGYAVAREKWWVYWRARPKLVRAIATLAQVIVMPQTSKAVVPLMYSSKIAFDQKVIVIARNDMAYFGVLSSSIHRDWVRRHSGTLGATPVYNPTDCFQTFPFPSPSRCADVGRIMRSLDEQRSQYMLAEEISLTDTYNRIHSSSADDVRLDALRSLHARLDNAVCRAYDWEDLNLDRAFRQTDEGERWTYSDEVRTRILNRLLEVNHARHSAEARDSVASGSDTSIKSKGGRTRKCASLGGTPQMEMY